MKTIFTTIAFAFFCISIQSQEFKTHDNGLIYSDDTITQLKFIVDSLNLKFKACETTKTYYAHPQAKALIVNINSGKIKKAKKDLENNISLEQLKDIYPSATISDPKLIIAYDYTGYDDTTTTHLSSKSVGKETEERIELESKLDVTMSFKKGDWIIDYQKGSSYRNENVTAFY